MAFNDLTTELRIMRTVYWRGDNIISPLAETSAENFERIFRMESGIALHERADFSEQPFYASLFPENYFETGTPYTAFEQLLIKSIENALSLEPIDYRSERTVFILSSTKGNISLLEQEKISPELAEKISLAHSAAGIQEYFQLPAQPLIISHACISGVLAQITAMRLLQQGLYDHAVICGADLITRFVLSGFQSFQAVSAAPCKPFDANRTGITLGEGAATVILSTEPSLAKEQVQLAGGAVSNDANHISGPSRTGRELSNAIEQAMREASVMATDIDMISAHGTATRYNDDMESKALLGSHLSEVPANSLKGYYGHTLGAAGLIETVILKHSLQQQKMVGTLGCEEPGTAEPMNVCRKSQSAILKNVLKTGSGFGGCNAAIVLKTN